VLWKKTVRNFDRQYQQDPASTQNSNPELQFRYVRGIRARKWSFQLGQSYIVGRSGQVTRRASEHETKLNFSIMLIYVAQCFLSVWIWAMHVENCQGAVSTSRLSTILYLGSIAPWQLGATWTYFLVRLRNCGLGCWC
jgi:hypothetical protein